MLANTLLIAAALMQAPQAQSAGSPVSVAMTLYSADGSVRAYAVSFFGANVTTYTYTTGTFCRLHPATREMPSDAEFGWRVDLKVLAAAPGEVTMHVEWRRMWEKGRPVTGPAGSRDETLHAGDRVSLDSIVGPADAADCAGARLALQIGFATSDGTGRAGAVGTTSVGGHVYGSAVPGGGGRGAGRGYGGAMSGGARASGGGLGVSTGTASASGAGGAGVTGAGGGRVISAGSGNQAQAWTVTRSVDGMTLSSERSRLSAPSKFDPATAEVVHVDLWLVHRFPDGTEQTQHLNVDTRHAGGDFRFEPDVASVPEGSVTSEVMGFVEAQRTTSGAENLSVSLFRLLSTSAGMFENQAAGKIIPMPKDMDVVAFDVPVSDEPLSRLDQARRAAASTVAPAATSNVDHDPFGLFRAVAGYQLSLRVRVSH